MVPLLWECNFRSISVINSHKQCSSLINSLFKRFKNCSVNAMATLEKLKFDNLALRSLPVDTNGDNYVREVSGACFSRVKPTPVKNPQTVSYSRNAMALLDLPESELERPEFPVFFSGNKLLTGSDPAAHCYCGHQFGQFAGQLGDGAAIYLGEILNKVGDRWEVQLKGAGKTPYSRQADGRKVLRSSIREYLCSEAMFHLGVPTTRAGACITSETPVIRDIFYDGHPITEKATIVIRIAPTFLRFGSFEIFKTRDPISGRTGPSVGRHQILEQMLNYIISTFYPEINRRYVDNLTAKYKAFFRDVVLKTAFLVAQWQCVGFCHGVLNTDNMSIIGLTIDYGPYGFMDRYNPDHICNASDEGGRYTFINQPKVCKWNLRKLAEALVPVLNLDDSLEILNIYDDEYKKCFMDKMRKKMGLLNKQLDEDENLVQNFLDTMEATGADFTNCFRGLSLLPLPSSVDYEDKLKEALDYCLNQSCSLTEMKKSLSIGMPESQFAFYMMLLNAQPEILEHLGKGLEAVKRELERRKKLEEIKDMDVDQKIKLDKEKWEAWFEMYSERLAKEIVADDLDKLNKERTTIMNGCNPRVVLRNYIAQNAITKAEAGDFSEVNKLLYILQHPFKEASPDELSYTQTSLQEVDHLGASSSLSISKEASNHVAMCSYDSPPPDWALGLRVT